MFIQKERELEAERRQALANELRVIADEASRRSHLRLVQVESVLSPLPPTPAPQTAGGRGIYEDLAPPPGTMGFTIILSNGKRYRAELPAEEATEEYREKLRKWFKRKDPAAKLRVI